MAAAGEARKRSAEDDAEAANDKKRRVEEDSDDENLPDVDVDVAKLLGDDSDSDSSSSSSSSDDEGPAAVKKKASTSENGATQATLPVAAVEGEDATQKDRKRDLMAQVDTEKLAEEDQQALVPMAGKPAPASPSSSSSSSSSSDSEDERSALVSRMGETPRTEADEVPAAPKLTQLEVVQRASLRREDLATLLATLPFDVAEEGVVRSFVRLAVEAPKGGSSSEAKCVLAEVAGIKPSDPYMVSREKSHQVQVRIRLKVKRGTSQREVKVASVSNGEVTEAELEQWKRLTQKTGVDPDAIIEMAEKKPADIDRARNFTFTEGVIAEMVKKKGDVDFDAQKESRMRFLVQCTQTQMDISNIRDNEARELEAKYKDTLRALQIQEARSTDMQGRWFEKRPGLFSLKMINKKNYDRQVKDDRHALDFTLEQETRAEAAGSGTLNPFQRRACRPLIAWDTVLTETTSSQGVFLPGTGHLKTAAAEAAKPAEAAAAEVAEVQVSSDERMRRYVQGSLGALPILRELGLNI